MNLQDVTSVKRNLLHGILIITSGYAGLVMKKLKHKHFYDEVYRKHYVFLLNVKTDKQVQDILKKNYPETYKIYKLTEDVSIEDCGGRSIQSEHRQIIIVRHMGKYNAPYWYSCLSHECLHAVMSTFEFTGVVYDTKSNNEHFTYYLESLIRIALEK